MGYPKLPNSSPILLPIQRLAYCIIKRLNRKDPFGRQVPLSQVSISSIARNLSQQLQKSSKIHHFPLSKIPSQNHIPNHGFISDLKAVPHPSAAIHREIEQIRKALPQCLLAIEFIDLIMIEALFL
eukprot:TRINITY_DN12017_c1_g1_i1.p1 TRINITY_DN12017_c1_g1~~TRINITY_DN12017_c1_g1_i1.p1  ORF type:complete len:126 (-),score=15.77 TRINITY_DN12017_c1_g1_i1:81-458(-)